MSSLVVYPQCEGDIKAVGISTNMRGISLEISHIAQEHRIGFILGGSLSLRKENSYDYTYNHDNSTNVQNVTGEYLVLRTSIQVYGTYKLAYEEYRYSLHILLGGVWDDYDGIHPSGGLEMRKPIKTKCLFVRGLYPYDFRAGILFQL